MSARAETCSGPIQMWWYSGKNLHLWTPAQAAYKFGRIVSCCSYNPIFLSNKQNQVRIYEIEKLFLQLLLPQYDFLKRINKIRSWCMRWKSLTWSCYSHVAIFAGKKVKLDHEVRQKRYTCSCAPTMRFLQVKKRNQVRMYELEKSHLQLLLLRQYFSSEKAKSAEPAKSDTEPAKCNNTGPGKCDDTRPANATISDWEKAMIWNQQNLLPMQQMHNTGPGKSNNTRPVNAMTQGKEKATIRGQ